MVALSSLGLLSTVSTFYTLGATAPVKTSISILKYGKKVNKLPSWLSHQLVTQAQIANKTKSLNNLKYLLQPIYKLYNKIGLSQTLNLLKNTKNLKELNGLMSFTSLFGKKSNVLMKITNGKAFNYAKNMPNINSKTVLYASTYGERGLKRSKENGRE